MLPGMFLCGAGLLRLQKVPASLSEAGDQVLGTWRPASLQSPLDFECGYWSHRRRRLHLAVVHGLHSSGSRGGPAPLREQTVLL